MSQAAERPVPPAIRPATDDDVLAMAKVHIASWRETYPGILPQPMLSGLSIAEEAIRWQRMLDRPRVSGGTIAFVAELGGSLVGYGSCGDQRTPELRGQGFTGEITELYVLRSAQGQGAGTGLMAAMARALSERGHQALSLWALEGNAPARHFYERRGGIAIGRKPNRVPEIAYGWSSLERLIRD